MLFWHAVRQAFPRADRGRRGDMGEGSCDYCNCAHYFYSNCFVVVVVAKTITNTNCNWQRERERENEREGRANKTALGKTL